MIVLFDTSTPVAKITIVEKNEQKRDEWEAGRELAKGMLGWTMRILEAHNRSLGDIQGIGIYQGPGSFTGLRIGMTVANTLADSLKIPIVSAGGEQWDAQCVRRLQNGENDGIALPLYDRDANITKPRK